MFTLQQVISDTLVPLPKQAVAIHMIAETYTTHKLFTLLSKFSVILTQTSVVIEKNFFLT